MRNAPCMKFSLSISRREMLINSLQGLQGQLDWIENHLAVKNAQALVLKNKIEAYEKKIAKALIRQAELEILAKKPKGLSTKQQQEMEHCKKTIDLQDAVLRSKATYDEWKRMEKEHLLHKEVIKFNQQEILAELNQLPRQRTPYILSPSIKETLDTLISDTSKSMRPARAA